jgi:hypothetical protein
MFLCTNPARWIPIEVGGGGIVRRVWASLGTELDSLCAALHDLRVLAQEWFDSKHRHMSDDEPTVILLRTRLA